MDIRRSLPAVGALLQHPEIASFMERNPRDTVVRAVRNSVRAQRKRGMEAEIDWGTQVREELERLKTPSVRKVINATGVLLHTNLGRAPISRSALLKLVDVASGYLNLEYDLETGERGSRQSHLRDVFSLATGAEDVLVVNNNAAAVVLLLRALAHGKEVVISRGELVEIGDSFRLPAILETSGARLKEVGTTNRTRIGDYESAIGPDTALLLKVHPSNFRMDGFVESASLAELVKLGRKHKIPVAMDLGSGCIEEMGKFGETVPAVRDLVKTGVDVLTLSGDKLLGGPQAGILLGSSAAISKMKKDPWLRVVRIDKLNLALLETVVREVWFEKKKAPLFALIHRDSKDLWKAATKLSSALTLKGSVFSIRPVKTRAQVGGGSLPGENISSAGVSIEAAENRVSALAKLLRKGNPPVVGRREKNKIVLDLRAVFPEELALLAKTCRIALRQVEKETV